ncbi:hypothetical protein BHM03_00003566 [Ensete ventricosum]|nr:hypothetical protein BHM03_00003566 [Ensete ventricosum]
MQAGAENQDWKQSDSNGGTMEAHQQSSKYPLISFFQTCFTLCDYGHYYIEKLTFKLSDHFGDQGGLDKYLSLRAFAGGEEDAESVEGEETGVRGRLAEPQHVGIAALHPEAPHPLKRKHGVQNRQFVSFSIRSTQ